jgi:hypothetical protein
MNAKTRRQLGTEIKAAEAAGWTVEMTKNCHVKFSPPPGARDRSGSPAGPVFTGSTASDHRAVKNLRAQLRRSGLDV